MEQKTHLPQLRKLTNKLCEKENDYKLIVEKIKREIKGITAKNGSTTKKEYEQLVKEIAKLVS